MTHVVRAENVSAAWVASVHSLLALPGCACVNLAVSIAHPTEEDDGIRVELDAFLAKAHQKNRKLPPDVASVSGTIFQSSFYRREAENPERHLYEMERSIRHVVRKHPQNRHGTYFERLVAYPTGTGEFNQIEHILKRLRSAADKGRRNGNQYELSIFHPKEDPYPVGFPCLSHVSLTLSDGTLHGTAVYRNQYFIARAYGNFLGIGHLLQFLADESGFATGELLCVASHAELEVADYGRTQIGNLLNRLSEPRKGSEE